MHFLLNLLFALLGFFIARYLLLMVLPEGADKDKIATIIAIVVAVVVFFANFATNIATS